MIIHFVGTFNPSRGSDRVSAINLANYINRFSNEQASLCSIDETCRSYLPPDIIIAQKGTAFQDLRKLRLCFPDAVLLITNPSTNQPECLKAADAAIVGSIEERAYYEQWLPCIEFPQVEDIPCSSNIHNRPKGVICYHGNKMHLDGMHVHLQKALEILVSEGYIFKAIYDIRNLGYSKKKFITHHVQWSIDSWLDEIRNSTVGICPSSHYAGYFPHLLAQIITSWHGFNNDIVIRYKSTLNAGRAFVFHQLNVPVVAEIAGCHQHILGDRSCGFIAYSQKSWYKNIKTLLTDDELSARISINALNEFNRLYSIPPLVNRVLDELHSLKDSLLQQG